jgi:8-oxo-dGTP pyrophosphatase MutT (NUDIX family)
MTRAIEPWHISNSKTIIKDKWIHLRADDCIGNDGNRIAPYYVLEYADWVHIICLDEANNICITEQYRHGPRKVFRELPCGVVNPGETPLASAKRELREETGIVAFAWDFLGSYSPNPATHTNAVHIFGCRLQMIGSPDPDPSESIKWAFISASELMNDINSGAFGQLLHLGSLYRAKSTGYWSDK